MMFLCSMSLWLSQSRVPLATIWTRLCLFHAAYSSKFHFFAWQFYYEKYMILNKGNLHIESFTSNQKKKKSTKISEIFVRIKKRICRNMKKKDLSLFSLVVSSSIIFEFSTLFDLHWIYEFPSEISFSIQNIGRILHFEFRILHFIFCS